MLLRCPLSRKGLGVLQPSWLPSTCKLFRSPLVCKDEEKCMRKSSPPAAGVSQRILTASSDNKTILCHFCSFLMLNRHRRDMVMVKVHSATLFVVCFLTVWTCGCCMFFTTPPVANKILVFQLNYDIVNAQASSCKSLRSGPKDWSTCPVHNAATWPWPRA